MKMRTQVAIIIISITVVSFLLLNLVSSSILSSSYNELEKKQTTDHVLQTANALENELVELNSRAADWAFWDDTYTFVQDINANYIVNNLDDSSFTNLRLNFMAFVNTTGTVVYCKTYSSEGSSETPSSLNIEEQISSTLIFWNFTQPEDELSGVAVFGQTPVLVVSKPILTSLLEGPIMGTLVIGRSIDSDEIARISETVRLPVNMSLYGDLNFDGVLKTSAASPLADWVTTRTVNSTTIYGYAVVKDVFSNPAIVLQIETPREVYQQGIAVINLFTAASLVIGAVLAASMAVFLSKTVVKPLTNLTANIKEQNFPSNGHHHFFGNDETQILIKTTKDTISQKMSAIEELAGMVGHDLRNPLTSINAAAYYLRTKDGVTTQEKRREMVQIIESSVEYSNKIINDLLEYSREVKLELTQTTPQSLIRSSVSTLKLPENVAFVDATFNEPSLMLDIAKIKRVFINLLQNAIDAMPSGGTLTVTSRVLPKKVEFSFVDTGIGMSKETQSKLWRPLFTTKAKGMGFGLPICRRIVEAHGGEISVSSTLGKGTTISVFLPKTK